MDTAVSVAPLPSAFMAQQQPHDEAPEPSPWALQLAARVEKLAPPTTAAVCAAAAAATIALLDDPQSRPGGDWHEPVSTWNGERIRKIVRRARASAWERAQSVPGVTVTVDGAEVRAFVPSRMADAPREITKLQIQSTPLDEIDPVDGLPAVPDGALLIAVTPHFDMSWGKQAAQCAHAAQRLWMTSGAADLIRWDGADRPIAIVHPNGELWDELHDIAPIAIHDGGFTEIPPGTNTTLAWWAREQPQSDGSTP